MKILLASFLIATASSTALMAAPDAAEPAQLTKAEAVSPERLELARRFIGLTFSPDEFIEQMHFGATQMVSALSASFGDEDGGKVVQQRVGRYLTAAEPKIRAHMPQLSEAYAQVYAREFSADELQQMIAFAQSPAGKRYLSSSDSLELDPVIMEAHGELGAELETIMDQVRKDICAEKAAQRLAAGDPDAKCPLSEEDDTRSS